MSNATLISSTPVAPAAPPNWEQLRVMFPNFTNAQLLQMSKVPVSQKFAEAMRPDLDSAYTFDPSYFNISLQQLDGYQTEQTFSSASRQNDVIDKKRQDITKDNNKRRDEIRENEKKAAAIAGDRKSTSFASTVFGSLGALLPLLSVLAVPGMAVVAGIGLFMGALELTSQILGAAGVKNPMNSNENLDISLTGLIGMAVDKAFDDNYTKAASTDGKGNYFDEHGDPMKAVEGKPFILASVEQNWKTGLTVGFSIAISLAMGYGGAKGMGALNKLAKLNDDALSQVKSTALAWQRLGQSGAIVADLAGAGTTAFDGVKGVQNAELESDTDKTRAEQTLWEGLFDVEGQVREEIMQFMRDRITAYSQNQTAAANTTRTYARSDVGFMPD